MRIGELASETGVAPKTIRFYEETGVLPMPQRDTNGYRKYAPDSIDRLEFVRQAQAAGLTLKEIATILEMRDRGEATCHHTRAFLEAHLSDVEQQIAELERMRGRLSVMVERSRGLDPAECTDRNRCQAIPAV